MRRIVIFSFCVFAFIGCVKKFKTPIACINKTSNETIVNLSTDTHHIVVITVDSMTPPKEYEQIYGCVYRCPHTGADIFWYDYFTIDTVIGEIRDTFPDRFGEDTAKMVCDADLLYESSDYDTSEVIHWCQEKNLNFLNDSMIKVVGWSSIKLESRIDSTNENVLAFYAKYEYVYLLRNYKFIRISCDTLEKSVDVNVDLRGVDFEVKMLDN